MDTDTASWRAHARVDKWGPEATGWARRTSGLLQPSAADFAQLGVTPDEVVERDGNLLTTAGVTRLAALLIGTAVQAASNTAARTGVGDGAGTAAVGDTDLSAAAGSTHRWFQVMDAAKPTSSAGVATFVSTFGTADGNFAWNEWGIDIGTPTVTSGNTVAACLLNHKTSAALGTKASGSTWAFTTTITLS